MLSIVRDHNFVEHIWFSMENQLNPLPICYFGFITLSIFIIAISYFAYSNFKR